MIFIALGSNLGNRLSYLQNAVKMMAERCVKNVTTSIIIETEAMLLPDLDPALHGMPYLNMMVRCDTDLDPVSLLQELKSIERELGRPENSPKWAARVIDLDIVFWDDMKFASPSLHLPHKELYNRPFWLHLLMMLGRDLHVNRSEKNTGIAKFSKSMVLEPKIMGIINTTPDSFSDGGKNFAKDTAVKNALQMLADGASIVDFGAQSTRPNAPIISADEEYARLHDIIADFLAATRNINPKISIDTYNPEVMAKLIENFGNRFIINDVTALQDERMIEIAAKNQCEVVIMHSLDIPVKPEITIPQNSDVISVILAFFELKLAKLQKNGIELKNIIIDPGIGFGKNAYQDLNILRNIDRFKDLGCRTLLAYSRKFFMSAFTPHTAPERDLETAIISTYTNSDFLRVHNVASAQRALVTANMLKNFP